LTLLSGNSTLVSGGQTFAQKQALIMKRTLSLLITLVFLFNAGSGYLIFKLKQAEARRESEEALNSHDKTDELVILAFRQNHEEEITWIRPGREFTYRGEMYDVVKTTSGGNLKFYHCYNDSKEKKLTDEYRKSHHSKKEPEKRRKAPNNLILYPQKALFSRILIPSCYAYSLYEFHYTSEFQITPSPPPKIA
jgi:hypothetical protein